MNTTYDILESKCIRVKDKSGNDINVSVLELFENAHEYKEILPVLGVDMTAVGIIRLLDLFLCDIYKPRSTERKSNIYDLLKKGRFDMDIIREYFDNCRKEGTSFELLGEEKAFAQYAAGEIEASERPIGFIVPTCKKEKNDMFYGYMDVEAYENYYKEDTTRNGFVYSKKNSYINFVSVTFQEYLYILCLRMFYSGANGLGWVSTLLGNNVMIGIIKANNVFETLLLNISSKDIDYSGIPFYRRKQYSDMLKIYPGVDRDENDKNGLHEIKFMNCYMTPYNFIRYGNVDYENGVIRSIYFKKPSIKGKQREDISKTWKVLDPNVYKVDGKQLKACNYIDLSGSGIDNKPFLKMYALIPSSGNSIASGMNISGLSSVRDNIEFLPSDFSVRLVGFDIIDTSKIREMINLEYQINKNVNVKLLRLVCDDIAAIAKEIYRAIRDIDTIRRFREKRKATGSVIAESALNNFMYQCEIALFINKNLMNVINSGDKDNAIKWVATEAIKIFKKYGDMFIGIECERRKNKFFAYLYKEYGVNDIPDNMVYNVRGVYMLSKEEFYKGLNLLVKRENSKRRKDLKKAININSEDELSGEQLLAYYTSFPEVKKFDENLLFVVSLALNMRDSVVAGASKMGDILKRNYYSSETTKSAKSNIEIFVTQSEFNHTAKRLCYRLITSLSGKEGCDWYDLYELISNWELSSKKLIKYLSSGGKK